MNSNSNIIPLGSQMTSGAIALPLVIYPGAQAVRFPDDSTLRGKVIKHIDICDEITKDLSGMDVFAGQVKVTFFERETQNMIIDHMPDDMFKTSVRRGNRLNLNHVFDFPNSYVSIANNNLAAPRVIYFVFWYDEPAVLLPLNEKAPKKISQFEVELNKRRTHFFEEEELRNARIRNILLSLQAITASGRESISEDTMKRAFITLRRNNLQFIRELPLYLLLQNDMSYLLNLQNIRFDFTNSYIEMVNPVDDDFKNVFFNVIVEE